jgi:hypothetical protein
LLEVSWKDWRSKCDSLLFDILRNWLNVFSDSMKVWKSYFTKRALPLAASPMMQEFVDSIKMENMFTPLDRSNSLRRSQFT